MNTVLIMQNIRGGQYQYFHFDTIPSKLGISIEYDTDTCNVHVHNARG